MAGADIYAIASRHLSGVKQTGNQNVMAFCPFHDNKNTAAFCMSLTSGLWICFGCKKSGNLRSFLHEVGVSPTIVQGQYRFAIEEAEAHRPPKPDPLRPGIISTDPLPEAFLGLFDMCPNALVEEGFDPEVLRYFDVGFDEKHMRITYPLRDLQGHLVGISGRTVIEARPRYKIYDREYEIWGLPHRDTKKGLLLWNGHRVHSAVFHQKAEAHVVVVEGFKACMWLTQMGVQNVVALMGVFLSEQQQWMLERMGATVYIMLDNNEAGFGARAVVAAKLSKSLTVKVVEYNSDKQQPSDLSPDEVSEALQGAIEFHLWAIRGGL